MAGTSWVNFLSNTKARAEDVNSNFDWIEGDIVPQTAGSKTNGVYDIGEVTFAWKDGFFNGIGYFMGGLRMSQGSTINFNTAGTAYIGESSAGTVQINAGNTSSAKFTSTKMLTQEVVTDYGFYHDRGDPSANDFGLLDLTSSSWFPLTLSSIVPADAKAVALFVTIQNATINKTMNFRKNGNTNGINISEMRVTVSNIIVHADLIVPCDSSGIIQYYSDTGFSVNNITVKGWWK